MFRNAIFRVGARVPFAGMLEKDCTGEKWKRGQVSNGECIRNEKCGTFGDGFRLGGLEVGVWKSLLA